MAQPTDTGSADPDRSRIDYSHYYPAWLDNLADDVTIEGSIMDGAAHGPDAVRTIIGAVRALYERQDFTFAGPYGDNRFLEDYTAQVRGAPMGAVALITFNADGQTQRIAAHYRPRSALLRMSRLMREQLADTPYAEHFLAGEA